MEMHRSGWPIYGGEARTGSPRIWAAFYSGATGRFLARSDLTEFSPFKLLKVKVDLKFREAIKNVENVEPVAFRPNGGLTRASRSVILEHTEHWKSLYFMHRPPNGGPNGVAKIVFF